MSKKKALFIGRWQPLHNGHRWLIEQKLSQDIPVLVAVRDILPDEKNPFTTEQTIKMIEKVYEDKNVEVIAIPDIESVNYGRGVGYEINEYTPPRDVGFVSATSIRESIKNDNDDWREFVNSKIHNMVVEYLKGEEK